MRIAIIGQQDFGKAVLEAFLARGDDSRRGLLRAGEGRRQAGPLRVTALEKGLKSFSCLR